MSERERSPAEAERRQHRVVGYGSEREDRAQMRETGDLSSQKPSATRDLGCFRSVLWRHAADRIGNAGSAKHKAVVRSGSVDAVSEAVPPQRGVKQIARIIASERAPRPVGASETRR